MRSCVEMLAALLHSPTAKGKGVGTATVGSSEAILLGGGCQPACALSRCMLQFRYSFRIRPVLTPAAGFSCPSILTFGSFVEAPYLRPAIEAPHQGYC